MFGQVPDMELVGTVENGEGVIDACKKLRPQVVIMDVRLPGIDGISAIKHIADSCPDVQTVMFSAYGDKRLLSDAIAGIEPLPTVSSRAPKKAPAKLKSKSRGRSPASKRRSASSKKTR